MTRLAWDQIGARRFETGVDRGVLYLADRTGVVWNGLTSVDEDTGAASVESFYYDGVKYLDLRSPNDFKAKLKAFTYPDEFLEFDGFSEIATGLLADEQMVRNTFGVSYRTKVGNDIDIDGASYKIHLLYNLTAAPENRTYGTLSNVVEPSEFGWDITGVPEVFAGGRPTCHVIIDSSDVSPFLLAELEDILYGTESEAPRLPSINELREFIASWTLFTVTDNEDGTFTVTGPDEFISVVGDEFTITGIEGYYIDPDTYTITDDYTS